MIELFTVGNLQVLEWWKSHIEILTPIVEVYT